MKGKGGKRKVQLHTLCTITLPNALGNMSEVVKVRSITIFHAYCMGDSKLYERLRMKGTLQISKNIVGTKEIT